MDKKLLFLLAINVFLFLIVRLSRKRKGWNNFFITLFTLFLTLTIVECVYRFVLKKNPFVMKGNAGFGTYAYHPITGYTLKNPGQVQLSKITLKGDTIYSAVYTIIADSGRNDIHFNHRAAYHAGPGNAGQPEIVFLGCSITFGEGIQDEQTLAYQTGNLCGASSLNLGLSGYGTQQAYQIYINKYQSHPDSNRRIFVYSFIPDHILRTKCIYPWNSNDPYFEVIKDSLVFRGKASQVSDYASSNRIIRYASLLYSFSFISDLATNIITTKAVKNLKDEDYQRSFLMMKNMQASIAARGDRLIVIYWDKYNWKGTNDENYLSRKTIESNLEKLKIFGVNVIKMSEVFDVNDHSLFIPGDGHPTAEANERLAKHLCGIILHLANKEKAEPTGNNKGVK